MKFFAGNPLVRLLVPFVLGIALVYGFQLRFSISLLVIFSAFLLTALFAYRYLLKRSLRWTGADGILIMLSLFVTGAGICAEKISETASAPKFSGEVPVKILLLNDAVVKERTVKVIAEIKAAGQNKSWSAPNEKVVVYFERDEAVSHLQYGDELLVNGAFSEVSPPKNPGEFNYREWLLRQGIAAQGFVKRGSWDVVGRGKGNFIKTAALSLRRYFLGKIHDYGISGQEEGVAGALLLGASDQLDPGLLQAYSVSGTLHVLSVSGMHVALVYIVLLRLLAPLQHRKYGKAISIIIQLIFLWFYATLTGLSPSVLRSVTMLSVVIAGKAMRRHSPVLNSLAASALLLLIFDPLMLFDVGFQLSYLAVASIVLLQPKLEQWYEPQTWFMQQVWTLLSVTIVAQIFTFPLGLYYFRQFPVYFLLSNLVVIPLSTIAMYAGLAFLICSPFVFIGKPLAVVFGFLLRVLDLSVTGIGHLPGSAWRTGNWQGWEIFILYFAILLLLIYCFNRKVRVLQTGFAALCMLGCGCAMKSWTSENKTRLVIFQVKNGTAIGFVNAREYLLFADTALAKSPGSIDFHVDPFFENQGRYNSPVQLLGDDKNFRDDFISQSKSWIRAGGKTIFIANETFDVPESSCDILLITSCAPKNPDSVLKYMHPKLVIADGSCKKSKLGKWKKGCGERKIEFYDTNEKGAFVAE